MCALFIHIEPNLTWVASSLPLHSGTLLCAFNCKAFDATMHRQSFSLHWSFVFYSYSFIRWQSNFFALPFLCYAFLTSQPTISEWEGDEQRDSKRERVRALAKTKAKVIISCTLPQTFDFALLYPVLHHSKRVYRFAVMKEKKCCVEKCILVILQYGWNTL